MPIHEKNIRNHVSQTSISIAPSPRYPAHLSPGPGGGRPHHPRQHADAAAAHRGAEGRLLGGVTGRLSGLRGSWMTRAE